MSDKKHLLVLNGPNLSLLGEREPEVYGSTTLTDIEQQLRARASEHSATLSFFQSNAEHELIEAIHEARRYADFILFNPAGFTHTSVALRDALLAVAIPFIEVHLSNPHGREAFRQHSYFSDIAEGVVAGFGPASYTAALHAALECLTRNSTH